MKRLVTLRWANVGVAAAAGVLLSALYAQAQSYTVLYKFPNRLTGDSPSALLDVNGTFYGTTASGGDSNQGIIFELTSQGKETTLYSFSKQAPDGRRPSIGPLIRDRAGNLYGTTAGGGNFTCTAVENLAGCGTVFRLGPTGQETILHSFAGVPSEGADPSAGLVVDSAGNLYGVTYEGGTPSTCRYSTGCGTVYKITTSGTLTLLYSFTGGKDGSLPVGTPVIDAAGNLYGTTYQGGDPSCANNGAFGCGVVFEVDPMGKETVLHTFTGSPDGAFPFDASLVRDSEGNLYGTTAGGGDFNLGTVFKIDASGNESILYSFQAGDSVGGPVSNLILDPAGNLYGTSESGGRSSAGSIFEVSSSTGAYTLLHTFSYYPSGNFPVAGLVLDKAGNLYGTTSSGGEGNCAEDAGCGLVFKLVP